MLVLRSVRCGTLAIGVCLSCLSASPTQGQSITPAGDHTGTIVTPHGNQFVITGGSYSADQRNLFHSFQQFRLSPGQIVTFIANLQLHHILGRITGGTPSHVDDLIQVAGGAPNLFLMNPAGIVFGANARLNVPASFVATTANGIALGDRWFSAVGSNQYSTLTGDPSAIAFTTVQPGAIVNAGHLRVGSGQTLALLAGTVVNTGTLTAPGGNLIVGAVPGETFVQLRPEGSLLSLEFQPLGTTRPNASEISQPLPQRFSVHRYISFLKRWQAQTNRQTQPRSRPLNPKIQSWQ